ncbi:MAG: chromosome segregation protein SMC [Paenibacillaceae bacterium ZCTH02-B3]|nr:MAG: chromosome segregation protein SMC [Paenibacillaceae bacterium ZCTH02-B3]
MHLKRIELIGFKSFADRTELEFGRGITAVVGPNGCGKSNISDGIRWVLGEQSPKTLRGGKMEDVIFAGSDTRKPVGYGEVSLTLDNSDGALPLDYTEVTVTRRLSRSGESEYYINRQPCRLKDITELFMDTGVGREAYSIIGQGQVEQILSTRAEDRRGIFEEASGIVKYKTRKKEAQKKLEDTEQNLIRIGDLIGELESRLEPLAEQARRAETYKSLAEELKKLEISLYVHQIEQVHRSWSEANDRLAELKERVASLAAEAARRDAALEEKRAALLALEEAVGRLQGELMACVEETEKTEGQLEVLKEREVHLKRNREGLQDSLASVEARLAELAAEADAVRLRREQTAEELQLLRALLAEEEARLAAAESGAETEARLRAELFDAMQAIVQARNDLRYLGQQREQLAGRAARLEEERSRWNGEREALEARRREIGERLAAAAAELALLSERQTEEGVRLAELERLREEALAEARRWEQRRSALMSRRDTLRELMDAYEGFQQGPREVLKMARRGELAGVHGAVAELIRTDARHETAVETALGGALQHIVTDDEAAARAAIEMLKKRQAGRATFLPLDVIRPRRLDEQDRRAAQAEDGFVGVAAELVECDARYADIVGSLLGQVIVAERLEQANRIAARLHYRCRVVTLDGDVVHPSGSMTGGSRLKQAVSLLGRGRQLEELAREIAVAEASRDAARKEAEDRAKEAAETSRRIEELRGLAERVRLDEQRLLAERERFAQEEKRLEAAGAALDAEAASLAAERGRLDDEENRLKARLDDLSGEERRLQEAVREAEALRLRNQSEKEKIQEALTERKVAIARLEQELQSLDEQAARLRGETARLNGEKRQIAAALEQNAAEAERTEAEWSGQREKLNGLLIRKEELSGAIELQRAERAERLREIEREETAAKESRHVLKLAEDELKETEIRANRADVELDNLLRKLGEEYEMSFEWAKAHYAPPEDVAKARLEAGELRRRIGALGEVNLGAIEEYAQVSERYRFLTEQRQDLLEAKEKLHRLIREMDEEMARRFHTTFEEIRRNFRTVFARLFGGGQADLILAEPDRLLDTGIEIVAQPPGKKLQNLQLLSGGERSLTAIALLFAILHVKPVPFCVLDEVEAALDEANVVRYVNYLREVAEQTQFIVVTHRKETMEAADVLYGVTMEESGVSKLVSVRLDEREGEAVEVSA